MGESAISNIFDSFKAMDVKIGSSTVTCHALDEVQNVYQTATLPVRILNPITRFSAASPFNYTNSTWNTGAGSTVNEMTWTIFDILLYAPINQTLGVRSVTGPIISFVKDYMLKMSNGSLVLPQNCWVRDITSRLEVLEYPIGSNNFYFGAIISTQVGEKIP